MVTKTKTNAARRLFHLIAKCQSDPNQTTVSQVLCRAVGLKTSGLNEQDILSLGMKVIVLIRSLIDEVEKDMSKRSGAELYKKIFPVLRNIFSGPNMNSDWRNVSMQITSNAVMSVLELMSETLPADSEESPSPDIPHLLDTINTLIAKFESSNLPPFHSYYARLVLNALKTALIEYAFLGGAAFRACVADIEGIKRELSSNQETLRSEAAGLSDKQSGWFQELDKVFGTVVESAKNTYYIGGAVAVVNHGVEIIGPSLFPLLAKAL